MWVPGNEFSMPRFVNAFAARVRARADTVAVLHSKLKHVRSYSLYSKHLTRTQFCTRTNVTHILIPYGLCKHLLFSKSERSFIFATGAKIDKNNRHTTQTVSRSAIIFQAEKAAPVTFLCLPLHLHIPWFSINFNPNYITIIL